MIREAERCPEQLVVPQSKPDQGTSVLPHELPNSISAPPLSPPITQIGVETMTGAVKPVPYDDVDEAGPSSRSLPDGLNATFTTSLTLHNRDPYGSTEEVKLCSKSDRALSRPTFPPEMSSTIWSSTRHVSNVAEATFGNSFVKPSEGSTFASCTRSVAESSYSRDRLGAQPAMVTSPGLSFGSPDGTITFQGLEPDPWGAPAEYRQGTGNGPSMNPWSM